MDDLNNINQKYQDLNKEHYKASRFVPPFHYYSPIPNTDEIKINENKAFSRNSELNGINLNLKPPNEVFRFNISLLQ